LRPPSFGLAYAGEEIVNTEHSYPKVLAIFVPFGVMVLVIPFSLAGLPIPTGRNGAPWNLALTNPRG